MNPLFDISHRFVFRRADAIDAASKDWFLPLGSWPDSAVIVWPAYEIVYDDGIRVFDLLPGQEPTFFAVTSPLDEYVACPVEWKSVAWQYAQGIIQLGNHLRVRLVAKGVGNQHPYDLACHAGFWGFSPTFIRLLAERVRAEVDPSWSTFELVFNLIQRRLELPEERVLLLCSSRLHHHHLRDSFLPTLLKIDEAIAVFDKDDVEKIKTEQKSARDILQEKNDMIDGIAQRREAIRAKSKATAKAKRQGARAEMADDVHPDRGQEIFARGRLHMARADTTYVERTPSTSTEMQRVMGRPAWRVGSFAGCHPQTLGDAFGALGASS